MTPPCPNCGTIYSEGPLDEHGWRPTSIASTVIFAAAPTGQQSFWGQEHYCQKCRHRWRVPYRKGIEDDLA